KEITDGTNPNDGCDFLLASVTLSQSESWKNGDCDGDRILNGQELLDGFDTDGDGIPNYLDTDDDGDGVLTIDEDVDHNGTSLNDDTDGDGRKNYLDNDDDGDEVLTINEDINQDGNLLDDDTDHDGIPNFLDDDDDGDGILTRDELYDLNHDGIPDYLEVEIPVTVIAVKDTISTGVDLPVEIDPLANDTVEGAEVTVTIVTEPQNGTYTIDPSTGIISYTPNRDFVGTDEIQYEICTEGGICSAATIEITVDDLILPPQIFTPNGNGENDYFVIHNLERYSNSTLVVFNRWGNKVYESNNYKNDWNGYANTGILFGSKPLPVGTYYYLLRYGNNRSVTGFIYLKR
ncbi:MAG TPA: gliding motility-associated C-terminal domain-containing protein, partial [Prolixibacteraceae bacterium]|nr:gliding motility-associated C-terminal domain-containing protein [Prolixibacteraceae bacterium]